MRLQAPPCEQLPLLYPRGPRSGPGCVVPVHPHLTDPMRPTPRHISTSPLCDLYEMPSLCAYHRRGSPLRCTSRLAIPSSSACHFCFRLCPYVGVSAALPLDVGWLSW